MLKIFALQERKSCELPKNNADLRIDIVLPCEHRAGGGRWCGLQVREVPGYQAHAHGGPDLPDFVRCT